MLETEWVECLHPNKKFGADIPITVPYTECVTCDITCKRHIEVVDRYLYQVEKPIHNNRIEQLYSKTINKTICPANPRSRCYASRKFCKYNHSCPQRTQRTNEILLRWRKVNMYYAVKYKKEKGLSFLDSKEIKHIKEEDLSRIDRVYKLSRVLEITTELIPYGNDKAQSIKETVKGFVSSYAEEIITEHGDKLKLSEFFKNGEPGDACFVVSEELIPRKSLSSSSVASFIRKKRTGGDIPPKTKQNTPDKKKTRKKRTTKKIKKPMNELHKNILSGKKMDLRKVPKKDMIDLAQKVNVDSSGSKSKVRTRIKEKGV